MNARAVLMGLLLILIALPTGDAHAQGAPARFERISIEQGLSQVTIYSILQDSRGLMWFGTENGLNRYDGYAFTVYKRDPEDPHSLSASTIRSIFEDSSGRLWIGTDGGLNLFDRDTRQFSRYQHDLARPDSLGHDTVTAMGESPAGTLWIGTGGGLDRLDLGDGLASDPAMARFTHYRHDPADPNSLSYDDVTALKVDPAGALWIATYGGGLNRFDPATGQFAVYRHDPAQATSLLHDEVTSILVSHSGRLWVGTVAGLDESALPSTGQAPGFAHHVCDPDDPRTLDDAYVSQVFEDSAGTVWVGTPGGLNELDRQAGRFIHYYNSDLDPSSLSAGEVKAIYEDTSGVLWIGTDVGGLNKLDRKMRRFGQYRHDPNDPHSLDSNLVWAIHQGPSGILWIGTSEGGLNGLDRSTGHFVHYQPDPQDSHSLATDSALAVYEDSTGTLWVGTWDGGLHRLDADQIRRQTGQFVVYRHDPNDPGSLGNDIVWAVLEDSVGTLWFGTFGSGLDRFDREAEHFTHFRHDPADPGSLSDDIILKLYQDRSGTLWVGTPQGLDRFDPQTETFQHWTFNPAQANSLSSNAAAEVFEDSSGTLWIGTDDGLNKMDRDTGTFIHYTEKDGLASGGVAGILEGDDGVLWISSDRGISRFDPRTGEFKNYDVRDGLQSNEFNRAAVFKSPGGEIFFGGVNGVTAFYPADIVDNPHIPPVVVTDFRIFNKPAGIGGDSPLTSAIDETQEMTLSYRDYVFSFEFAALDYTIPQKNRYAYMLEGFDKDWTYVDGTRRFASYANLPAGRYTFRIKGSNNDGVWNEAGTSIALTVTPPPWRTWWAYTLYGLLAIGMAVAVVRYRVRELERRHLERTMWAVQEERDRIASLLEARRQLVASVTHDLRTPVTVVRGHLESALEEGGGEEPLARRRLEVVLQEIGRLSALLDDLFTLSRLEVNQLALTLAPIEVIGVARRAVSAMSAPAWRQGKVQVALAAAEGEMWAVADEQRLLQVLMNLLHNAVRHTLPGGVVVVGLEAQPEAVVIRVQDSGEGIHPDDLPRIWERFYRGQSQAGGGTGLGLALVKELTMAMGGSVAAQSTIGEGSCFSVALPLGRLGTLQRAEGGEAAHKL